MNLLQGPPGKRGSRGLMGEPGPKVCIALVEEILAIFSLRHRYRFRKAATFPRFTIPPFWNIKQAKEKIVFFAHVFLLNSSHIPSPLARWPFLSLPNLSLLRRSKVAKQFVLASCKVYISTEFNLKIFPTFLLTCKKISRKISVWQVDNCKYLFHVVKINRDSFHISVIIRV